MQFPESFQEPLHKATLAKHNRLEDHRILITVPAANRLIQPSPFASRQAICAAVEGVAVTTCTLPSLLYGAEAWYEGRTKNPQIIRAIRKPTVSTRMGWHLTSIDQILALAARAILPAWRTTPNAILLREAGLPSVAVVLEEAKLRFALHLQTADINHLLAQRIMLQRIGRGSGAGGFHQPRSKVQRLGRILPATPRCVLVAPYYSQGSRMNPTIGQDKKEAAQSFTEWWEKLPHTDLTIFSDGSEQYYKGEHAVIYGYAIYISQVKIASGQGSLHHQSLVFDAEAVGAWRRLQHTISLTASYPFNRIWMCIDSTLVIWGTRGTALASSQWAFLACQGAMKLHNIQVRWSPGHTGITGNEEADRLANAEAKAPSQPTRLAYQPTALGIRTIAKALLEHARNTWWEAKKATISA
jgi:hypothetical protein